MARKPRVCAPGLTYHVKSRCIEDADKMKTPIIKDMVEDVLNLALDKYSFECISYSILDNHFHFIIRTLQDGETISRIMQFIKSRIAERYNKMMHRTGPFWNERFKDHIIEFIQNPLSALMHDIMHLAYNPVRKKYVSDPRKYRYSSINAYLDETYQSPVKITLHPYFLSLGSTFNECVSKLLLFEDMYRKRITYLF